MSLATFIFLVGVWINPVHINALNDYKGNCNIRLSSNQIVIIRNKKCIWVLEEIQRQLKEAE